MSLELDDGYLKTTDDCGQIFLTAVDEFMYADYEALGFGDTDYIIEDVSEVDNEKSDIPAE